MPKRVSLILVIVVVLAIGIGFTTIDSSSMQGDMNAFEDALTNGGIQTSIDNSSALGDIAIKLQSLIDLLISSIMSFINKLISLFT